MKCYVALSCFNRINSDRSIPTESTAFVALGDGKFQSYQFRQINPDHTEAFLSACIECPGFNRINSDRSIPTAPVAQQRGYQWSFNRINSDRSIPTSLLICI